MDAAGANTSKMGSGRYVNSYREHWVNSIYATIDMNRVRNRVVKVREIATVFLFTLSCPGSAKEQDQQIFTDPNIPISDSGYE